MVVMFVQWCGKWKRERPLHIPQVPLETVRHQTWNYPLTGGGRAVKKIHGIGWLVLMKFHEKNTIKQLEDTEPIVELGRTWYTVVITHLLGGMQTAVFVASDLCISPSLASRMPLEIRPCTVRQLSVIQRCWDPSARFVVLCLWFYRYVLLCSQLFE